MFVIAACAFQTSGAQNWNADQQAVWKQELGLWSAAHMKDSSGFISYFSPDYMGWDISHPTPTNYPTLRRYIAYELGQPGKDMIYRIDPLGISVLGDVAIADYYYSDEYIDENGKKKDESGRWTDIWMKQNNKWLLVGDHGGADKTTSTDND